MDDKPKENVVIDGDRVIAFINAVKMLGDILEELNIIDVKDAFLRGKQLGCIERVLETERKWKQMMGEIADGFEMNVASIEKHKVECRAMFALAKEAQSALHSEWATSAITNGKALIEILDRIEHHNQAGTLKLLASITTP